MRVVLYYGGVSEVLKRISLTNHEKRICTKASPQPVLRIEALFAKSGNIQRCSCIGYFGRAIWYIHIHTWSHLYYIYLLDVFRHCIWINSAPCWWKYTPSVTRQDVASKVRKAASSVEHRCSHSVPPDTWRETVTMGPSNLEIQSWLIVINDG